MQKEHQTKLSQHIMFYRVFAKFFDGKIGGLGYWGSAVVCLFGYNWTVRWNRICNK